MHNHVVELLRFGQTGNEINIVGRTIHESTTMDQGCWLCEPGGVPKGTNLAARLVSGTRPAVETIK